MAFVCNELQYTKSMIQKDKCIINYYIRNNAIITNYNGTRVIQ